MDSMRLNPFADYGARVSGAGFVDRRDEIIAISNRIIHAPQPGCVAIVGPRRIGKSSLACQMLSAPAEDLFAQHLLTVWCDMGEKSTLEELFRFFVRATLEIFEDHVVSVPTIMRAGQRASECDSWFDLQHYTQRFFKVLKQNGWRIAIVLDEFDAARKVFQQNALGFQALRSLADNPDWRVAFVTCSRRSIPDIEAQSASDISNFHNIFHYLYLKPFALKETQTLLARLNTIGLTLSDAEIAAIQDITGGHPFLSSAFGFHLAQSWLEHETYAIDDAQQRTQPLFIDHYDNLSQLLQHDHMLEKLLQILFGPLITATTADAEQLIRYGLLVRDEDGVYHPFSEHFGEYLRLTERSYDLWPLWKNTERCLRLKIAQVMEATYTTSNWAEPLERARPKLRAMLEECRARQADEQRKFGGRASNNLLDFTYPGDLYQIIRAHWSAFQPLFTNTDQYWEQRFNLLARVRNPVAHNRDEVLTLHERQIAEGYCRELLHRLSDTTPA